MDCGKGGSLLSNTFMCLEVNVTSWSIDNKEEKWIPKVMEEYFWVTLQTTELIESLSQVPKS